jgi:hypothetical protein
MSLVTYTLKHQNTTQFFPIYKVRESMADLGYDLVGLEIENLYRLNGQYLHTQRMVFNDHPGLRSFFLAITLSLSRKGQLIDWQMVSGDSRGLEGKFVTVLPTHQMRGYLLKFDGKLYPQIISNLQGVADVADVNLLGLVTREKEPWSELTFLFQSFNNPMRYMEIFMRSLSKKQFRVELCELMDPPVEILGKYENQTS